jgi:hypothetical protein
MLGTFFLPRDNPYGTVSFLAAFAVVVTIVTLSRTPDRMSSASRAFGAVMTALLLPLAFFVLWLPREDAHTGGIDRMEALVSFFILASGAFGAGLACTRGTTRWVILEGLIISVLAGGVLIFVAADLSLIFWVRVETPIRSATAIVLITAAFALRLFGLLVRLRRMAKSG